MLDHLPRSSLATLPTALERGPELPGGARLWVKRDDLTGLGGGGNKARKLEFLCGAAVAAGATALVTVGAAQSNHCRMTAAAGAVLGLDVHLVLSGEAPGRGEASGNQLLSGLFGAQLHHTGLDENEWRALEDVRADLTADLEADQRRPYSIPIGGSTAVGALGYANAFIELIDQTDAAGIDPSVVVFTSSSGGTHAGLIAGRRVLEASGRSVPDVVAIGVAKGINHGQRFVAGLVDQTLGLLAPDQTWTETGEAEIDIDPTWLGDDYAIPTPAGDAAIKWAASRGGWLMDRTYSGKGLSGLLGLAQAGRFEPGADVVFIHTGGWPAMFAADGTPV